MNPKYPVYVVSKGRWESRLTVKALEAMAVPYRIVVEPQELARYAAVIDPAKILVLPFSDLGRGSIPARNWVWDHAAAAGHARHWIVDDNIYRWQRFHENRRTTFRDGTGFRIMEAFADRFENVRIAGPNYDMFLPRRSRAFPPFRPNTRIYSCLLIDNGCRHRWRGRYNEDTDLCLRVLKDGDCTVLFNAVLAKKMETMKLKGGNTDELYRRTADFDGRLAMARSLQRQHPDVVRVVRKWGRWQHLVDYRPFKGNRLVRRPDLVVPAGPDEFGMRFVRPTAGGTG